VTPVHDAERLPVDGDLRVCGEFSHGKAGESASKPPCGISKNIYSELLIPVFKIASNYHGKASQDPADRRPPNPPLPEVQCRDQSPHEALQALRGRSTEELKLKN
jgi:hypothetical protein